MLSRHTGKVIHIDFGDCFEVAMKREKYPEKIPFRLTRMLQNAMEVSKIEGNFKTTCINTMTVLRENSESLMAVLEAFIHDPLINWRLMEENEEDGSCMFSLLPPSPSFSLLLPPSPSPSSLLPASFTPPFLPLLFPKGKFGEF
jgi:FKBP12-rapamycin complex-associated protein